MRMETIMNIGVKLMYVLGTSPVEDFKKWKSAFKDNESYRSEHGELGYQVFQSVDNPNKVSVLFNWDDTEDPRAFFESDEMSEVMAEAGLTGAPEITVLESVIQKSAQQPSA